MILNIVTYLFYALGAILAISIVAVILYIIINGPKALDKDKK